MAYNQHNTGQIVKSRRTFEFVQIPNELLKNNNLSFKAKGLLCLLLSFPDDWVVYKNNLVNYSADGKASIDTAWKELVKEGYILSVRMIEGNLTKGWNHIVYDTPQTEKTQQNQGVHRKPDSRIYEDRISETRISENPPLQIQNTEILSITKKEKHTVDFFHFWNLYSCWNAEAREDARVQWNTLSNDERLDAYRYCNSWAEAFTEKYDNISSVPMAKKYLSGKRWNDEY